MLSTSELVLVANIQQLWEEYPWKVTESIIIGCITSEYPEKFAAGVCVCYVHRFLVKWDIVHQIFLGNGNNYLAAVWIVHLNKNVCDCYHLKFGGNHKFSVSSGRKVVCNHKYTSILCLAMLMWTLTQTSVIQMIKLFIIQALMRSKQSYPKT